MIVILIRSAFACGTLAGMEKFGSLKLDLYLAMVSLLFPLGWTMSGFPPNIVLACFFWAVTIGLLIHAFWIYEQTARLHWTIKCLVSFAVPTIIIVLADLCTGTECRQVC
jgi:hypothetical protein